MPSFQAKSTTYTSIVGTQKSMPVGLPCIEGMTLVTTFAAPLEEGMMLPEAARPTCQSLGGGIVNMEH